jgi:hypothetical protein
MKRVPFQLLVFLFISANAVSPAPARPDSRITDFSLVVEKDRIKTSFFVEDCFSPEIENAVESGVPATLTLTMRLYQYRTLWRDKRLSTVEATRKIQYDTIKKEYQVFLQDREQPIVVKYLWKAKQVLSLVENLELILPKPLRTGVTYNVRLKATMEPAKLPFRLENLLFFLFSPGRCETDWYIKRFRITE